MDRTINHLTDATFTLLSAALAVAVSKWFLLLTAFVGINQWLHVTAGACPASTIVRRTCRLRSSIYEDEARAASTTAVETR